MFTAVEERAGTQLFGNKVAHADVESFYRALFIGDCPIKGVEVQKEQGERARLLGKLSISRDAKVGLSGHVLRAVLSDKDRRAAWLWGVAYPI